MGPRLRGDDNSVRGTTTHEGASPRLKERNRTFGLFQAALFQAACGQIAMNAGVLSCQDQNGFGQCASRKLKAMTSCGLPQAELEEGGIPCRDLLHHHQQLGRLAFRQEPPDIGYGLKHLWGYLSVPSCRICDNPSATDRQGGRAARSEKHSRSLGTIPMISVQALSHEPRNSMSLPCAAPPQLGEAG